VFFCSLWVYLIDSMLVGCIMKCANCVDELAGGPDIDSVSFTHEQRLLAVARSSQCYRDERAATPYSPLRLDFVRSSNTRSTKRRPSSVRNRFRPYDMALS